ncbi:HpcH/HpaI aldolase [Natrialba chahannaoensis JCM 10990]|uniref:HpcH/HpaI aldolase n=1 Tax=Natrialba chahannaoensis JCM 10990 TaxID=1227492 RepID=M0AE19_9EURY|nr:aldolase/citrate lyase family protein [Natrialba chahannaoensis]ELY96112.1 HpcH/HpaI aldolase [Natrialba chahannaoensis JCM 10990]
MSESNQQNELARAAESEQVFVGASVETASEQLVELYGMLGLDWVWIDLEHKNPSPRDGATMERLARAAECGGAELVVRLPDGDPATIRKVLDTGVRNVAIPRVETAAEVERAVRTSRFEYDGDPGRRGLAQGRTSGYGAAFDGEKSYHGIEDANVQVGVLVENRTAVDNIEDIAAITDLGFVFPGPGDLGVSIGKTLEYEDPEVRTLLERVRKTCVQHDVPLMGVHGSNFAGPEGLCEAVEQGYQFINLGNEFGFITKMIEERLEWIEKPGNV